MRASVLGTGSGLNVVAKMYQKTGIEVEIVSFRDAEAVKRACAARVNFVSIHSPPFLHRAHVMLALENKHHVVCDKPFRQVGDGSARDAFGSGSRRCRDFLNFEYRHEPWRRKVKELIDQGAIGALTHIQSPLMLVFSCTPLSGYSRQFQRELAVAGSAPTVRL